MLGVRLEEAKHFWLAGGKNAAADDAKARKRTDDLAYGTCLPIAARTEGYRLQEARSQTAAASETSQDYTMSRHWRLVEAVERKNLYQVYEQLIGGFHPTP
jgi:hypothetical protein